MKPIHHPKSNAEDRNQKSMPTMIADTFMFISKSEYFGYLVLKCKHFGCVIFHTKTHLRKNSWRGTGTRVVSLVATLLALLTHFFWIIISPLSFELLSTLNSNQHFVLLTFYSTLRVYWFWSLKSNCHFNQITSLTRNAWSIWIINDIFKNH